MSQKNLTLGERLARIETFAQTGTPALKEVDVRVMAVEKELHDLKGDVDRLQGAITNISDEVKKGAESLSALVTSINKIQTILIYFVVGFTANTIYQDKGLQGIVSLAKSLVGF